MEKRNSLAWGPLVEELEKNTPEKIWVVREELLPAETFEIQKVESHFILVLEGILRLENENKQILHYFASDSVLYQSPYELRVQETPRLVAETEAKIVLLHREFFLNYAANKPRYYEKLMRAIMTNAASFMFELMRNDVVGEDKVMYSFQQLIQSLSLESQEGFYELPPFIHVQSLSRYTHVSRKSIYAYLEKLEERNLIKRQDNLLFIKSLSLRIARKE